MKFLVDAQLPARLKDWLKAKSFDAAHTNDLPRKGETKDIEIADVGDAENRIVITKDRDFFKLHILQNKPRKLLLLTAGNVSNQKLIALFEQNFETAPKLFDSFNAVEIGNQFVIGHKI